MYYQNVWEITCLDALPLFLICPQAATAAAAHRRSSQENQYQSVSEILSLKTDYWHFFGTPFSLRDEEIFWAKSGNGCGEFSRDLL